MKQLQKIFMVGHLLVIALFFICALALMVLAATDLWHGLFAGEPRKFASASTASSKASAC